MERMLDRLPPTVDRREGSFLYAALAPTAWELSEAYASLERALRDGFAATATRESLILLGRERGLTPRPATYALVEVRFPDDAVTLGSAYSVNGISFTVESKRESGIYRLRCKQTGEVGNLPTGKTLIYSDERGSMVCEVLGIAAAGLTEEETESFRARYFDSLTAQSFGGNRMDYVERVSALDGVGSVKVLPGWNGEGSVKIVFTDANGEEPSESLVEQVQSEVEGFAPIGHTVTVSPARERFVDITATITYEEDADRDAVQTAVMDALVDRFDLLTQEWHDRERSVVRYGKLFACILSCSGVASVTDLVMNGTRETAVLESDEIPVLGELVIT